LGAAFALPATAMVTSVASSHPSPALIGPEQRSLRQCSVAGTRRRFTTAGMPPDAHLQRANTAAAGSATDLAPLCGGYCRTTSSWNARAASSARPCLR
jgi:hypothetical protein